MKRELLALGGCLLSTAIAAAEKPNLLIIHTDEHSFRTLSCYQKLLPEDQAFVWGKGMNSTTPNIDRIASAGAICMSYYCSAPVSTPSRASMVSGLYSEFTGAAVNGEHIREDIPTFATILSENGYSTSYLGKWHLAGSEKYAFDIEYNGGFEDNRYMMTAGHSPYLRVENGEIVERGLGPAAYKNAEQREGLIHYTDFFTEKTIEVMDRDKDKPFCVMVSIPDPHTPDYAHPPYNTMYDHLEPQAPATMSDELAAQRPLWAATVDKNSPMIFNPAPLKQYFGMVKHIDDCVGRMLDFLEENDLIDNTIVIFTSDHGDMFYEHNRMNKAVPYEASTRIPFVISYPKKIPAGKVISSSYVNVDFTPTILGLMGIKHDVSFHGEDTSKDFTSSKKNVTKPRFTYLCASGGKWVCAIEGQYKLILDVAERPYLYDLKRDPNELINFVDDPEYYQIAVDMKDKLLKSRKEIGADVDNFNFGNL